jgi:2-keto-4-pentenoate hydratase
MDRGAIEKAADILWQARLAERRMEALPADCRPASLDEGYAIQDAMTARSGQAVAGWKIAATSEAGQRHIGVTEPLAGRLFAGFLLPNGARRDARPMHMRVVEAEFAFRFGRDLPSRGASYGPGRASAYGMEEVMGAAADLHLAIELPDARFERFAEVGPPSIAADDAFASWFILGPKVADWRGLDLKAQPVRATRNGEPAGEGTGANALGDPRVALTWLVNERAKRGGGVKAGEVVITGTCVKPVEILPGDHVTAEFPGLGEVSVAFD